MARALKRGIGARARQCVVAAGVLATPGVTGRLAWQKADG